MLKNPPVSAPWTASQWRAASVERILTDPAFRDYIRAWQAANVASGATARCFDDLAAAAGLGERTPISPTVLQQIATAAAERIPASQVVDLFCLVSAVQAVAALAVTTFPPHIQRALGPTLDFLEGTIYRSALLALEDQIGAPLTGLRTSRLLPGDQWRRPPTRARRHLSV